MEQEKIVIRGLRQNNLKNVSLDIPKGKIVVFTGVSASVIVDQSRLGGNARSTVGTISDMYAALRLLYARIGTPYVGTASYFSFNDPNGMCKTCSGIGKILDLDIERAIDPEKSWNEGML